MATPDIAIYTTYIIYNNSRERDFYVVLQFFYVVIKIVYDCVTKKQSIEA